MNYYTPSEFVKTVYSLLLTKVTMRQARLVRRPVYIRGIKSITGAIGLTTGRFCRFDLDGKKKTLYIGKNCDMGDLTHIVAHEKVVIGDNVLIASKVFISDTNHGDTKTKLYIHAATPPKERQLITKPVLIGNNVWIGENVVVLAGAIIGDGCIIGANALVSKSIPPYSIVINNNEILDKHN